MAAQIAARQIRDRMAEVAAGMFEVAADEVEFRDDRVFAGNESIGFGELAARAHQARVQLSAAGFYKTPKVVWDRARAQGRPFYYFAYGAACTEVVVDTLTGENKVLRTDILHDVGRSLNPALDIGQIEGAFVQGMGWLTTEELVYDKEGRLRTHAPSTYKIPVASDVPADFRVEPFRRSEPGGIDLSLEGGRGTAAHACDFSVRRAGGCRAFRGARAYRSAGCASDAGKHSEGGSRGWPGLMTLNQNLRMLNCDIKLRDME